MPATAVRGKAGAGRILGKKKAASFEAAVE
jgi:hypothetical protein